MYGTEPSRLRFRDDMASTTAGRSSTQAGPTLDPMVPITNNDIDSTNTACRAEGDGVVAEGIGAG